MPEEKDEPPKRQRRRRVAEDSGSSISQPAVSEVASTPVSVEPDKKPIKPIVHKLNAIAKRTVRTGQYESFEISTMAEIEPDPKYTARENVRALNQLVVNEVNSMVDQVRRQFEQEASR